MSGHYGKWKTTKIIVQLEKSSRSVLEQKFQMRGRNKLVRFCDFKIFKLP